MLFYRLLPTKQRIRQQRIRHILKGLIISQDVIQEYLSRNHKGNCYRQKLSTSTHCHVTTSDQSELSVVRASGPSVRFQSTGDVFKANAFKMYIPWGMNELSLLHSKHEPER